MSNSKSTRKRKLRISKGGSSEVNLTKRAIMIEPRDHPLLIPVLLIYLSHLPPDWEFTIFHGSNNLQTILKSPVKYYIDIKRVRLIDLKKENLTIDDYNQMLLLPSFWEQFDEDRILLFEIDTVLCSNSPHKIDQFLKYDYIGAPWVTPVYNMLENQVKHLLDGGRMSQVGNSGLSISNPKKMLEALAKYGDKKFVSDVNGRSVINVDIFFAIFLPKVNANIAPVDVAEQFSSETIINTKSLGAHKVVRNFNRKKLRKFHKCCPESLLLYAYSDKFLYNVK